MEEQEEMRTFYQQLGHQALFTAVRIFAAGSSVEVQPTFLTSYKFGIDIDDMDNDVMLYNVRCYAFPLTQCVPASYKGRVLRIYPGDHAHPGYVKLLDEESNTVVDNRKFLSVHKPNDKTIIHGPAGQTRYDKPKVLVYNNIRYESS